jgi:hypothetical protein
MACLGFQVTDRRRVAVVDGAVRAVARESFARDSPGISHVTDSDSERVRVTNTELYRSSRNGTSPEETRDSGRTGFFPVGTDPGRPARRRPAALDRPGHSRPLRADPVGRPSSSMPDSDKHKFLCLPCTACTRSAINRARHAS